MTKNVVLADNNIYGHQYGVWIGNGGNGYAGDVDINVTMTGNNIHDNIYGGVVIEDEDRADGSSVSVTGGGNSVVNNGEVGYFIMTSGDGDVTVDLQGEHISGHTDSGAYIANYGGAGSVYDIAIDPSTIVDNALYGINNTLSSTTVTATDN